MVSDPAAPIDSTPVDAPPEALLEVRDRAIHYGAKTALAGVNFEVRRTEIFGIIGPANSGKTSFLRAINRMDMFNSNMHVSG